FLGRNMLQPFVLRVVFHRLLTMRTPIGRSIRSTAVRGGHPLIRIKPAELRSAGVERVSRIVGVRNGRPLLQDGRTLDVANVLWCSGSRPDCAWIDLPIFDDGGEPQHHGGMVEKQPGLYFVGLNFLYAMSSSMIHGVGRDAARIAAAIQSHVIEAASGQ